MNNKGILIFLSVTLVIVLGGFGYMLSTNILKSDIPAERSIKKLEQLSESTEIDDIEQDLIETDLADLDKELADIDDVFASLEE